jgi:glycosyltransferase involved in cell wall biosynthesis
VVVQEDPGSLLRSAGFPAAIRPKLRVQVSPATAPRAVPTQRLPNALALIATRNYIPYAKVTASTFATHHPEFQIFLLLVDGEPADAALFKEGNAVLLNDLGVPQAGFYAAKFTASELANSLKPVFLQYLAAFVDTVVYLDCDIGVFSRLTEMLDALSTHDLILVPHMLTPPPRPEQFWVHPTRADTFNAGLINAGSFAMNLSRCEAFLQFWREANLAPGAFFEGAGFQTDQQYLNWALVNVSGVYVLRSTRYNVAYWNLHERDLRCVRTAGSTPHYEVDGNPLGFFHFSGYDINNRFCLSRHDGRHSVYNLPAVAEILGWYSDTVLGSDLAELLTEQYQFDRLANGYVPTKLVREILKRYEAAIPRFNALTETGADELCAFLMSPLPATGSMLPLIAAEVYRMRPDLREGFPDADTDISPNGYWRWFCRHGGVEFDLQFLSDRFRKALISDSIVELAKRVAGLLPDGGKEFLGSNRLAAATHLRSAGYDDIASQLMEATEEWYYFTDIGAGLEIYSRRPGLQDKFPDPLGTDNQAFSDWLLRHGSEEHGCSPSVGESWRNYKASESLARIYSYMARREELGEACETFLLADNPGPLLRDLIRGAGDGLEYDIEDVVILRFIHRTRREMLVPLYLELPSVRRRPHASRTAIASLDHLPGNARHTAWAVRGCKLHADCFDRVEAEVDGEMRRWAGQPATPSRDVLDFLREEERRSDFIGLVQPAYRAALKGVPKDAATAVWRQVRERERRPAVNVFGYFNSDIGVGVSSRGLAEAVVRVRPVNRVPLHTAQLRHGTEFPALLQRFDYLADTNVFVSYPHQREDLYGLMPPEYLSGRRNIIHLAWEQKDANCLWKAVYNRFDEIWTISDFAASSFRKMFPGRVRVVPNVVEFETFPICHEAAAQRLRGEHVRFLFVFDANSSIERKNPEGAVDAFVKAFKDTPYAQRVRLTLKIGGMHRIEHAERLERLRRKADDSGLDIRFDGRQLLREAMLELIADTDCYISLHRAEGFGYTLAEAMSYGVPVIASGYSGNLEYMTKANSFLVPCKETFVKSADGPFQRGSVWGEPDVDAAAALLRAVVDRPGHALTVGERGKETVRNTLSAAAVADKIWPALNIGTAGLRSVAAE